MISKILVPVDFSDASKEALDYAISLAQVFNATIVVTHVWTAPAYVSPSVAVHLAKGSEPETLAMIAKNDAQAQLDAMLEGIDTPEGIRIQTHVRFGYEPEVILEEAQHGYDLIVMGTHGRSGVSRFIMGSVAEKVVRSAPCPVVTLRSQKKAGRESPSNKSQEATS